jgi:hypothetical protein
VLIVDKPLTKAMYGTQEVNFVAKALKEPEPFQGGYADFIQYDSVDEAAHCESPSRASMYDDLVFYHTRHHKHLSLSEQPISATTFAQKIIASEYMLVIEYNRYLVSHLGWKLTRREGFEDFDSKWVEKAWSDINGFHRRLDDHARRAATAGKAFSHKSQARNPVKWISTTEDFRHIEKELLDMRDRSQGLQNSLISLASLLGNKQALVETKSVRVLTILGMTFLPLSLVASLFSMSGHFSPGAGQFWVYFAVSIPLVFLVFGLAYVSTHATKLLRMFQGDARL